MTVTFTMAGVDPCPLATVVGMSLDCGLTGEPHHIIFIPLAWQLGSMLNERGVSSDRNFWRPHL